MKKIIALIMALVMVMGLAITASAADENSGYTITITVPAEVDEVTYEIYKVFDAVPGAGNAISYSLVEGKTTAPAGFTVDAAGNVIYSGTSTTDELTADDITAIKSYVADDTAVKTVTTTGGKTIVVNMTSAGYYFVSTGNGAVVAIDSTNPNAIVRDKYDYPTVSKLVNGKKSVTVDEGNEVEFTVTIDLPAQALGGSGVYMTLHDTCDGVEIKMDTVKVTWNHPDYAADQVMAKVKTAHCDDHALDITFGNAISGGGATKVVVTYTGIVKNAEALLSDESTNTAWITIHPWQTPENPEDPYYESVKDTVTMSNAKISIFKYTPGAENAETPLAGAGFVVAKKDADGNITGYYQFENGVVNWVEDIEDASEHFSAADGNVPAFEGLAEGTYYIVEKTVPAGYNKAADQSITIGTNDAGVAADPALVSVVNNTGSELPSTGGIGTTLFYVIGGLMMTGAAVLLITKKRMTV